MSVRVTHGRHCSCSACAREDWTRITGPCGMHGRECPPVYAPVAGSMSAPAINSAPWFSGRGERCSCGHAVYWHSYRGTGDCEHDAECDCQAFQEAEILDACCGGRHWWWDKAHPLAIYMDEREAPPGSVDHRPNWECRPDVLGDFRQMPFEDGSFRLVLFDPPHIVRPNPSGRIVATFGALLPETEQDDLRVGFAECWRVLAPGGTLVFKWGAGSIKRVQPHFPATPIVGTRSPRGGQTRWLIFYKPAAR